MPTKERAQKAQARDPDATKERYEGDTQERSWDANGKLLYDELLKSVTTASSRSQDAYDKLQGIELQATQNAVSFAGFSLANCLTHQADLNAQKLRHGGVEADRLWNIDEVSHLAAGSTVSVVALAVAVAAAVAEVMNKDKD